jgi:apolipoprotein D and lipocalin family protein
MIDRLLVAALLVAPMAGQSTAPDVTTVEAVNLERYLGEWFEVARLPAWFQRSCVGDVRASYAKRPDGRIDVVNRCRTSEGQIIEAHGVARVVDTHSSAKLKVRFAPAALSFLPFVWGDYWVIGLADDYSWAVVGSPDRKYLWILSRSATLEATRFDAAMAIVRAQGFNADRLQRTINSPAIEQPSK